MKKFVYLFLALLVPGLVFVFLKYAGSNKFDVPNLPEPGKPLHSDCVGNVEGPYAVPDSVWKFVPERGKPAHVVVFSDRGLDATEVSGAIREEIGSAVSFVMGGSLAFDSAGQSRWKSCVFLLQPPAQSVLLDSEGRIRGHYDLRSREETDRLRVELKILTESY